MSYSLLFVDDEIQILNSIRRALRRRRSHWQVHSAGSGSEALELLRTQAVHVVITDMRMPEMDGACFIREARRVQPSVLRIGLSGYSELDRLAYSALDFHQFWAKPCELEVIMERLDLFFAHYETTPPACREAVLSLNGLSAHADSLTRFRAEISSKSPDFPEIQHLIYADSGLYTLVGKIFCTDFLGGPHNLESVGDILTALEFLKIIAGNPEFPVTDTPLLQLEELKTRDAVHQLTLAGMRLAGTMPSSTCPQRVAALLAAAWGYPRDLVERLASVSAPWGSLQKEAS